jgi:hypothetical protein
VVMLGQASGEAPLSLLPRARTSGRWHLPCYEPAPSINDLAQVLDSTIAGKPWIRCCECGGNGAECWAPLLPMVADVATYYFLFCYFDVIEMLQR